MTAILTSLFVVALASFPPPENQDIREQVKKNGSMSILINKEHPPADLGLLVARADLVVRGVVLRGESSLLDNKVVTHYAMQVARVDRGKVSQVLADGPWNREKAGLSLPDFLNEVAAAAKK